MPTSETRTHVLEALRMQDGLTKQEIYEYVVGMDNGITQGGVGRCLAWLVDQHTVFEREGRFYRQTASGKAVQRNSERDRIQLPAYLAERAGQLVTIEQSPTELENVVRVQFQQGDHWFTVPVTGALRICLGPDTPTWSPLQETNEGISAIRLVFRDGSVQEFQVKPNTPITIAPKE